MESSSSRLAATVVIWTVLMIGMVFLSFLLSSLLGENVVFILILLTGAGIMLSGFIWQWGQIPNAGNQESNEALKRNRLTMALRDLSDDELKRLRQRLANGDIDDDQLARLLDESEASKAKRA